MTQARLPPAIKMTIWVHLLILLVYVLVYLFIRVPQEIARENQFMIGLGNGQFFKDVDGFEAIYGLHLTSISADYVSYLIVQSSRNADWQEQARHLVSYRDILLLSDPLPDQLNFKIIAGNYGTYQIFEPLVRLELLIPNKLLP